MLDFLCWCLHHILPFLLLLLFALSLSPAVDFALRWRFGRPRALRGRGFCAVGGLLALLRLALLFLESSDCKLIY